MMTKTKKTSLLAMLLLIVTCTVAWAIDFSAGNYIPKGSSSAQNSAGAIIVTSLAETVGNADLSTDGGALLCTICLQSSGTLTCATRHPPLPLTQSATTRT